MPPTFDSLVRVRISCCEGGVVFGRANLIEIDRLLRKQLDTWRQEDHLGGTGDSPPVRYSN